MPGRWSQYDEDEYRLPEGMKRIGYDADSGRYLFRDTDGSIWQGPQGSQFGEMTLVDRMPSSVLPNIDEDDAEVVHGDLEASSPRNGSYRLLSGDNSRPMVQSSKIHITAQSYRTLFPFFLLIAVVLLLIYRLILSPSLFPSSSSSQSAYSAPSCPDGTSPYFIQPGESCWEVSRKRGWSHERFKEANLNIKCEKLMPGTTVCVPPIVVPGAERPARSSSSKTSGAKIVRANTGTASRKRRQ
ncbi:hypothetical protein CVT24_011706 [Panaeolus cyanescens]|uniref:LysM domain-containing protein n=1 Tax=Panaeolus cyanescens TaxID=181874 RepID=A0A409YHA0_9AGAR|nr:hypothetical protein CVT24_011706 [Panaeolus cyanescens]